MEWIRTSHRKFLWSNERAIGHRSTNLNEMTLAMVKTIETSQQADSDKVLRLAIPVEQAGRLYHVVIMLEPEDEMGKPTLTDWPPGFIESTAGAWVGELERPPQGEFEKREEL